MLCALFLRGSHSGMAGPGPRGSCQHHGFRLGLGLSPGPTEQEIRKYLHTQSHREGQAALWDCVSILLGVIDKMSVAVHPNYTGR